MIHRHKFLLVAFIVSSSAACNVATEMGEDELVAAVTDELSVTEQLHNGSESFNERTQAFEKCLLDQGVSLPAERRLVRKRDTTDGTKRMIVARSGLKPENTAGSERNMIVRRLGDDIEVSSPDPKMHAALEACKHKLL